MAPDELSGSSPYFCSISAVPSVPPKRVRARSLSAAQIEVMWEAVSDMPERVLGYEVWTTEKKYYVCVPAKQER